MQPAYFISLIFTILLTPLIKKFSFSFNLLEKPDSRRRHTKPTARLGGIAIFISFLITCLILSNFPNYINETQFFINQQKEIYVFFIGFITYFLIGLIDDLFRLSPWPRLAGQSIIAAITWFLGLRIENYDFFISGSLGHLESLFLTIFWIMAVTNAINWLDGLDGLASGVSSISFVGIALIATYNNNLEVAIISAILAGSCAGFLNENAYPAKIFMGDSGSFLIGFSLATLTLLGFANASNNINFIPIFIILLIPILDMNLVIIRRLINQKSPFFADRTHLHYKLLDLGFSQRQIFLIYFFTTNVLLMGYLIFAKIGFSYNLIFISIFLNLFFLVKRNIKFIK